MARAVKKFTGFRLSAEVMNKERLNGYILEAAKAASYEERFGVTGYDLSFRLGG
jgi:hypothetical protein